VEQGGGSPSPNSKPIRRAISGITNKLRNKADDASSTTTPPEVEYNMVKEENKQLRETIRKLEVENERLHRQMTSNIVIETFEGEGKRKAVTKEPAWYEKNGDAASLAGMPPAVREEVGITMTEAEMEAPSLWCDEPLEDGTCPIEPDISFLDAMKDRALWLVGLLIFQSCSGFILSRNEALLENHPFIIYFLTMLVGAGGNAGNQASVRGM
jgi:hypothetical protein